MDASKSFLLQHSGERKEKRAGLGAGRGGEGVWPGNWPDASGWRIRLGVVGTFTRLSPSRFNDGVGHAPPFLTLRPSGGLNRFTAPAQDGDTQEATGVGGG